ncbi:MAG: 50S ribosomal protein L11 methyltransferase [Paludibacteraceae bacterium]|nr:50S ribosomal protein L11 methyltransferase [Paludibacteraceae bacterium]
MEYTAVKFKFRFEESFAADLFVAFLAENGFDSFENWEEGIEAYIPSEDFSEEELVEKITSFPYQGVELLDVNAIPDQNWNEEWEKNFFSPIVIGDECVIHSSFHKDVPQVQYDIQINPKMAFGTGHHATTSLIIAALLKAELQGKALLDMGCGTAVLAILAAMRGATPITAIDIDTWCVENANENAQINKIDNLDIRLGDARLLKGMHFDVILANINRNILLSDMKTYATCLNKQGELYLSGFYTEDIPILEAEALKHGLKTLEYKEKNNWAMMRLLKE